MIKVQILILLASLSIALSAFGADWVVVWTGADDKLQTQEITDDDQEFQFTMAKFQCRVSKTALTKLSNYIFEIRYLSCSISKETTVQIDLSYNVRSKDYSDSRSLVIRNDGKGFIATLMVLEKRK